MLLKETATDPHPTGSSLKPFLAYGPAIENMKWSTNHAVQDESSYWVDGSQFKNYDTKSHGTVSIYDALRQSFQYSSFKTWQQVKSQAGNDAPSEICI